jgi:signal transduction histidine kinase
MRELNSSLESRVGLRTAELQKTQEELQRALAAEREVGELKSRFVSLVSHEFRTPLGITMSAVELLRGYFDRLSKEKREELLDDIHESTLRMSGMMEQVLLLGRVEAGKLSLNAVPIDLHEFGAKFVDEMHSATNRKCEVQFRAEGDLEGARGDESLVRHALANLISNAVKYSPAGRDVDFLVRREGNDAVFTVRDYGIGIPETDQVRLFEAFHRAKNVGETPGTGLGLLIVKRCVELHHGTINFESREGQGTTFTVRFPLFG